MRFHFSAFLIPLLVIMMALAWPIPGVAPQVAHASPIFFEEDFSDCAVGSQPSGWSVGAGAGNRTCQDDEFYPNQAGYQGQQSFKQHLTSSLIDGWGSPGWTPGGNTAFSMGFALRVFAFSTSTFGGAWQFGFHGSSGLIGGAGIDNTGDLSTWDSASAAWQDTGFNVVLDTWYVIRFDMDRTLNRYSTHVNGTQIEAIQSTVTSPANSPTFFGFSGRGFSKVWLDWIFSDQVTITPPSDLEITFCEPGISKQLTTDATTDVIWGTTEQVQVTDFVSDKAAKVVEVTPTTNFHNSDDLPAETAGVGDQRGWVEFDISGLPAGITIQSGILHLYRQIATSLPRDIDFNMGASAWTETVITWNNAPGVTGNTIILSSGTGTGEKTFDITNHVQDWYSGAVDNHGLRIRDSLEDGANAGSEFRSDDYPNPGEGVNAPFLRITYLVEAGLPAFLTLNQQTGLVTGTVPSTGTFLVIITADVSTGQDLEVFQIIVEACIAPTWLTTFGPNWVAFFAIIGILGYVVYRFRVAWRKRGRNRKVRRGQWWKGKIRI